MSDASSCQKAGNIGKNAPEESQEESSFGDRGKRGRAEGGEKNGNESGNLFHQPLCDISAGDHFILYMIFLTTLYICVKAKIWH